MEYHWEWVSADQVVLYEEGHTFSGALSPVGVAATINKVGPYSGSNGAAFRATGPLLAEAQDFASFEEAMAAVEEIVWDSSGSIEGR